MINELLKNPPGLAVKCFATGTIILQNEFNFDMLSNSCCLYLCTCTEFYLSEVLIAELKHRKNTLCFMQSPHPFMFFLCSVSTSSKAPEGQRFSSKRQ